MRVSLDAYETQAAFVEDEHRYSLFTGGIGAGKSHAGALKAINEIRNGGLGLVIAPTFRMLRDATWRTSIELWRDLGLVEQILRGDELRVVFRTGAEALFRSAEDPERLRGPNASWAWIDEAAQCHPDTWPIVIGRLRQGSERCWVTTTPRGMNWLYEVFFSRATDETAVFRARTEDNPFNAASYARSLRQQYEGSFARQELDAEFVADVEGALLEWAWLDEASADGGTPGAVVAGLDVAGPGEDETVLCVRDGQQVALLRPWPQADTRGVVLAELAEWRHRGLKRLNVDAAGIGWERYLALADELEPAVHVVPVNVGERATTAAMQERFANLKAELYWGLRETFRAGEIRGLRDRTALAQLASIRYAHDPRGRVVIESKDRMRERGERSPDRAEAIMLAFAPPSPHDRLARALDHAQTRRPAEPPTDPFLVQVRKQGQGRAQRSWGRR